MIDFKTGQVRRHRQNIERYSRLLATELTDPERQYLHKRIAEEYAQLKRLEKAAFRATAWQDDTRRADGEFVWAREGERKSGFEVGSEAENPSRRGRVAAAIALLADPQDFRLHFGDVQAGPENARWRVRAIANLVTGEQYLLDWNGRRLRIDPAQDPALLFGCHA